MKNFLRIFKKSGKEAHRDKSLKEALKDRYLTFQNLLKENTHVLGLMADMEEKLSGEYLFDRHYFDSNIRLTAEGVLNIIKNLNAISNNKYIPLHSVYQRIYKEIDIIITHKFEIPASDFTIPFENLSAGMSNIAGGKVAHLGEIKNRLNLLTPEGFSITAYAFKRFMEHNRFREKINERLSTLRIEDMDEINKLSQEIQKMVVEAEIPEELSDAINKEVGGLELRVQNAKCKIYRFCPKQCYF